MGQIYLIRHAEAEGNLYKLAHGQYNSVLTEKGKKQVRALEQRFRGMTFDFVYSSDLSRAVQTAGALQSAEGSQLQIRKDLREMFYGDWEGVPWGEIRRQSPGSMTLFLEQTEQWHPAGGETYSQLQRRMLRAFRAVVESHPDKSVAIVSHNLAIRSLLDALAKIWPGWPQGPFFSDNTAVSVIENESRILRLSLACDTSHLSAQLRCDPRLPGIPLLCYTRDISSNGDISITGKDKHQAMGRICYRADGASGQALHLELVHRDSPMAEMVALQLLGQAVIDLREQGMRVFTVPESLCSTFRRDFWEKNGFYGERDRLKDL